MDIHKYMTQLTKGQGELDSTISDGLWDCIAISAADAKQKEGFEQQISVKLSNEEIPKSIKYLVIADPTGPVVGSAGATFHILKYLEDIYGQHLYTQKIWIIHAGGSSKRLPNFSCTGKLFCPLPFQINGKTCNILRLKLMTTSPFIKMLHEGGVFISGCDDIETYSLSGFDSLGFSINPDGVAALAHPSTIAIGTKHGVYVMPSRTETKKNCWVSNCLEVLQKPNYMTMKAKGALLNQSNNREEQVYTDSMLWCGPNLVKKMVSFARVCKGLYEIETCIFGDFLACMGSRQAEEKLYWTEISAASAVKRNLANHFQETPLEIIVLEQSHFYHLGTMPEYIENLQPTAQLFQTFNMKSIVGSNFLESSYIGGIVINSLLEANIQMKENSIMDHCVIKVPLVCERNTILSNCRIEDPEVGLIPSGWMFHTAAVMQEGNVFYITIAFKVDDDLKSSVGFSLSWKDTTVCSAESSLWKAQLFEAETTMEKSFTTTWKNVNSMGKIVPTTSLIHRYSMEDIIKLKYVPAMLAHTELINQTTLAGHK